MTASDFAVLREVDRTGMGFDFGPTDPDKRKYAMDFNDEELVFIVRELVRRVLAGESWLVDENRNGTLWRLASSGYLPKPYNITNHKHKARGFCNSWFREDYSIKTRRIRLAQAATLALMRFPGMNQDIRGNEQLFAYLLGETDAKPWLLK